MRISLSVAATALAFYLIHLLRGATPKLESEARKLPGRLSSIAKELSAVTVGAFSTTCHAVRTAYRWRDVEGELDERTEHARERMAALGDVQPHAALADDTVKALRGFGGSVDVLVLGAHQYRGPEHRMRLDRTTAQRLADDPPAPLLVLASPKPDAGARRRPA